VGWRGVAPVFRVRRNVSADEIEKEIADKTGALTVK
jgi:hypothetical protein